MNNKHFDIAAIRRDFPILSEQVNGRPVVFLDSAASSQKPTQVLDAMSSVYRHQYANAVSYTHLTLPTIYSV